MKLRGGPNKLSKLYYSTNGYWKGYAAISKLADTAKVSEDEAKQWLEKQALWQIYLPAPKFTKQIYYFYHMTHIERKLINVH